MLLPTTLLCIFMGTIDTYQDVTQNSTRNETINWKEYYDGPQFLVLYNLSLSQCRIECENRIRCYGINYWRSRRKCELLDREYRSDIVLRTNQQGGALISMAKPETRLMHRGEICRGCTIDETCVLANNSCMVTECHGAVPFTDRGLYGNIKSIGSQLKFVCLEEYPIDYPTFTLHCNQSGGWDITPSGYNCPCPTDLISGPYGIPDSKITATSFYSNDFLPSFVRLKQSDTWAAHCNVGFICTDTEYIQFGFNEIKKIEGIATLGHYSEFVTAYKVLYSTDCVNFDHVLDDGGAHKVFPGNRNSGSYAYNPFPLLYARCIRVNPTSWVVWITTRVGLFGC